MAANYEMNKLTKKGWTKQPNAILKDKDLTSDAKVIIYALLSVSGDYHISESGIASMVNLSLDRVKKAVKLLKSTGYIEVSKVTINNRLNGYIWKISDTKGIYRKCDFRELENQATENPTDGISSDRETKRPKTRQTENPSTYEYTERYEHTNNQRRIDEHTEEDEERENQEASHSPFSLPPYNPSSFTESSSVVNAPSPASKNTVSQVITQTDLNIEQAFNRFCDVYPNLGDIERARAAFLAIPDISNICQQVANSVEWFEKNKLWDNWKTGQKNVSCPGAVRFLKEGHWKQYLKSGATMSEEERIMAALNRSRQQNNSIFGGTEYESH